MRIDWRIINALRGIAALYVVLNHARGMLFTDAVEYAQKVNPKSAWSWWEWFNIVVMQHTNLSTESVILFFVLSGFSIAHSLSGNPSFTEFYKRRLIRLYPTYVLGILFAIFAFNVVRHIAPDVFYTSVDGDLPQKIYYDAYMQPLTILKNLLYDPTDNFITVQYWSLPLEVIFYLIAPFFITNFRLYTIFTVGLYTIGWILKGYVYYGIFTDPIPFQFFIDYGIYFWVGVLMYRNKDKLLSTYKPNKLVMYLLVFIIFEIAVICKSYLWGQIHNKMTGFMMIAICYLLLFGFLKHTIRIKWLEKIGEYSYTLYVSHGGSLYIVCGLAYYLGIGFFNINLLYIWYIGVGISLLFAYLLYWVAEYPSTRYLSRLRNKKKTAIIPPVAPVS